MKILLHSRERQRFFYGAWIEDGDDLQFVPARRRASCEYTEGLFLHVLVRA